MKAAVAGLICLDMTPIFGKRDDISLVDALKPGHLVQLDGVDIHLGGCVSNTGLAMNQLGLETLLIGKVGNDPYGNIVLEQLKKTNLHKHMISSNILTTAYSFILAYPGVDRIFLHHSGANDTFKSSDVFDEVLKEIDLLHFGYPTIMTAMYQHNGQELIDLMRRAKSFQVITSLDLSAIDESSEAGHLDWIKILEDTLPYVDIFAPSLDEILFILNRPLYENMKALGSSYALDVLSVLKPLCNKLHEMGSSCILIKCGIKGLYLSTSNEFTGPFSTENSFHWSDIQHFEHSYKVDCVLSATGAGDTTIAAFLVAYMKGYSPETTMQLASATGALCVTKYDAISGLLDFPSIQAKIKEGWKKNQ